MRPDLQLALIGYGLAGRVFHAPLIQHTPGLYLHSVVSSRRDELRRHFTDVHVRAAPAEVFEDPAVDAVIVATPNEQHAPLAIAAVRPTACMPRRPVHRPTPAAASWWTHQGRPPSARG